MTESPIPPASAGAVIVTYNGMSSVGTLLPELDAALQDGCLDQVVVVDNASTDGTATMLRTWAQGREHVTVVFGEVNVGFPRAVNMGLREVTTTFVGLINPDVSRIRLALESCLELLRNDTTVGLCGPRLIMSDGEFQVESARRSPGAWSLAFQVSGFMRLYNTHRRRRIAAATGPLDAQALSGAFLVGRTSQLLALGGLDERLFMYLEDVALCRVVRREGLRLVCVLENATHDCGVSRSTLTGKEHRALDNLIGEVPWLLAHDEGRSWSCRAISILGFLLGLQHLALPNRSSRTGLELLRWSLSAKPRYVGWTPDFATHTATVLR